MIEIDKIKIKLPQQLGSDARFIGRKVAENLQTYRFTQHGRIDRVVVPRIQARPRETASELADKISQGIVEQIKNSGIER